MSELDTTTEPEALEPEAAPALEVEPGRVAVVSPQGKVQTVPREQLGDAEGQGYRAATRKEYDTAHTDVVDAAGAAVLGAGRGYVPGYDAAVIKIAGALGADEEAARRELNYSKDTNPLASAGGEVLGSLAQVYMLPGGAASAEATAASNLGRAAQRAAGIVPRAFAEGAAMGLQSRFSEDVLGNHELVAENYLAAGLQSGLLGAFLGAGFAAAGGRIADAISGTAGRGASRAERAGEAIERTSARLSGDIERGANELGKKAGDFTGKDIEKLAEREFGYSADGLGERVRKKLVDWSSGFSGRDRKAIDDLTALTPEGKEARRIVAFDSEKELEATMREFRKSGDEMLRSNRLTMEEFRGELKTEKIAKAVARGNEETVAATTRKQLEAILDVVDGELNHAAGVAPQSVKSLESISRTVYAELGALEAAVAKGEGINEAAFIALDRSKRDVQAWVSGGYNGASRIADPFEKRLAQRSVETLDRTQNALRGTLEDASLWGKAADIQKAINADWTIQIDASKRFNQALTTEIGRDPANPFMQLRGVDPAKADTYARGLLNPNADLTHKAVRDYVDSTERLAKTLRENVDLPPAKMAEVERIIASAGAFRKSVDRAEKTLTLTNQYKALVERNSDGFAGLMGTLGLGVGGPLGGAVGLAAGTLANPGRAVAQMAALERMGTKLDERFGSGIKAFLSGSEKAKAAADAASEGVQKVTAKSAETMVHALRAATRSPAAVTARIAESLRDVQEVSPKVAQAAAVTMTRAAIHMQTLLPQTRTASGNPFGPGKEQPLRASELAKVRPMLEVLQDPGVVADALHRGQVSREHVRALAAIFPQRYARMQAQVRELGMQEQPELSEQKLVALSILFGVPASAQMKPETVRGFQETFTAASKAQAAPGPKIPMRGQAASKASGFDRVEAS